MPALIRPSLPRLWWLVGIALFSTAALGEETRPFQFKELRLSLPESWTSRTRARLVPAQPLYSAEAAQLLKEDPLRRLKAGYETMPRHLELRFGPLAVFPLKEHAFIPEITVHSVADFARIFEPEKDSTKNMLRTFAQLWDAASDPATVQAGKPLPFIPALDAEQGITVLYKPLSFAGGKGFRFITQFDIEASLLSEQGLVYVFEGMTHDRKTYVLATFPVRLEGLLKADAEEHLGYRTKPYLKFEKEIDDYHQKAKAWLESNQSKIEPELKVLDDIASSIAITAP